MTETRESFWIRRRRWIGALALLVAFAWSSVTRIAVALRDPAFQNSGAPGLLRTDPAFLFHVTDRIVENGGSFPADLRATRDVEWPNVVDVASIETVGQELFVAWTYLACGKPMPLHLWAVWAMGLWASLVAVGVFGIACELTREVRWASAAVLLWASMLVNYRTIGFVLIREDFAFPFLAAHLWLALRAARVRTSAAFALAGLSMLAAAATWHAAVFVLAIEAAVVLAWTLRTGENPFEVPRAWLAVALPVALSFAVPVLRAKHFALSLPMAIGLALVAAAFVKPRRALSRAASVALVLVLLAALLGLARVLGSGSGDYSHVVALLLAKLQHLGVPPSDPRELDFGVRLLWQGPFRTADFGTFIDSSAGVLATLAALILFGKSWIRGRGERELALALGFTLVALLATWMVERTAPMFGFASAALAAAVLARIPSRHLAVSLAVLACLAHGAEQRWMQSRRPLFWYSFPPSSRESDGLLRWVAGNVPAGEPIAADYSTSAALLAFTRHPILCQPKYETRASRERIESFCAAFYGGSPAELAAWMRERRTRWIAVNRPFLAGNATDLGGILPQDLPRLRDRACWRMMSDDPAEYGRVAGFALAYETPPELGGRAYRVYRLE